uniref:Zinc knuckle CX2CX4HX4C domain-containing protein n=1 Tax=Cannabis sativa TaxID=3483 RepID=A0A803NJ55_CANSA
MKKCGERVMGFFFDLEEDCTFVMEKRPWLVNGVLLNLRPWPLEGELNVAEFEVARFWVQFHGLPMRRLSDDNTPIIAKKVGAFVKSDDKQKVEIVRRGFLKAWVDVWISHPFSAGFSLKMVGKEDLLIQFKYEKLPYLCFNCGKLAHLDRICNSLMAMVIPKVGDAAPILNQMTDYGLKKKKETKGTWRRRNRGRDKPTGGHKAPINSTKDTKDGCGMLDVGEPSGTNAVCAIENSTLSGRGAMERVAGSYGPLNPNVPISIGQNFLNLPRPDFAMGQENGVLDIGPSIAQSLEIPHAWVCKSQRPHNFPEDTPIVWPTDNP